MSQMGANSDRFSGVSARKRGCRLPSRLAFTKLYSFCRQGTGKRRQHETICTFGTRRYSCKSLGRLNCDGCVSRWVCGTVCVDWRPRAAELGGQSPWRSGSPDLPGPMMAGVRWDGWARLAARSRAPGRVTLPSRRVRRDRGRAGAVTHPTTETLRGRDGPWTRPLLHTSPPAAA